MAGDAADASGAEAGQLLLVAGDGGADSGDGGGGGARCPDGAGTGAGDSGDSVEGGVAGVVVEGCVLPSGPPGCAGSAGGDQS